MNVTVRTYGGVRADVGTKTVRVELDPDATVADALDAVEAETGGDARAAARRLLVLRDGAHLDESDALAEGDTLSLSDEPMSET